MINEELIKRLKNLKFARIKDLKFKIKEIVLELEGVKNESGAAYKNSPSSKGHSANGTR